MTINLNLKIEKKDLWLLAAIMVFLIGVGFVIGFGDYSTGNPNIMGHSSDEIMVKNSSGNLVTLQNFINQSDFGVSGGLTQTTCYWTDWVNDGSSICQIGYYVAGIRVSGVACGGECVLSRAYCCQS